MTTTVHRHAMHVWATLDVTDSAATILARCDASGCGFMQLRRVSPHPSLRARTLAAADIRAVLAALPDRCPSERELLQLMLRSARPPAIARPFPIPAPLSGMTEHTARAILVYPDGRITVEQRFALSLESLQRAVGGYIEAVTDQSGSWTMYVNEEGKVIGLPVNRSATALATAAGWRGMPGDVLVGPVVFVGPVGEDGEHRSVPAWLADLVEMTRTA